MANVASSPESGRVKPVTFFDTPPSYQTFLVTLWEERSQDRNKPKVWRFRLEVPRTGEQYGFATFEELVAFLKDQMRNGH